MVNIEELPDEETESPQSQPLPKIPDNYKYTGSIHGKDYDTGEDVEHKFIEGPPMSCQDDGFDEDDDADDYLGDREPPQIPNPSDLDGKKYYSAGNYKDAQQCWEQTLKSISYIHGKKCYRESGYEQQLAEVEELELSTRANLAQCYLKVENWGECEVQCQKVMEKLGKFVGLEQEYGKAVAKEQTKYPTMQEIDDDGEEKENQKKSTIKPKEVDDKKDNDNKESIYPGPGPDNTNDIKSKDSLDPNLMNMSPSEYAIHSALDRMATHFVPKVLYRWATALYNRRQLDDPTKGIKIIKQLIKIEPENKAAIKLLYDLQKLQSQSKKEEKKMSAKIFQEDEEEDSKDGTKSNKSKSTSSKSKELVTDDKSNEGYKKLLKRHKYRQSSMFWKAFGRPFWRMTNQMKILLFGRNEEIIRLLEDDDGASELDTDDEYGSGEFAGVEGPTNQESRRAFKEWKKNYDKKNTEKNSKSGFNGKSKSEDSSESSNSKNSQTQSLSSRLGFALSTAVLGQEYTSTLIEIKNQIQTLWQDAQNGALDSESAFARGLKVGFETGLEKGVHGCKKRQPHKERNKDCNRKNKINKNIEKAIEQASNNNSNGTVTSSDPNAPAPPEKKKKLTQKERKQKRGSKDTAVSQNESGEEGDLEQ